MNFEFELKKEKDKNLYVQLYDGLKEMIINKKFKENQRLPAIRKVANFFKINTSTVVKAYDLLEKEGFIYKKIGSGCFISKLEINNEKEVYEPKGFESFKYGQIQLNSNINFASSTPSISLFPIKDFKKVINEVLDRDGGEAFTYQETQGYYPLRETISKSLKSKNINTSAERIQIVSGAQQAIDILSKILITPGDKIAVENPTYSGAISSFKNRGANIHSFSIKKDGIELSEFENLTNFHNPTGINWSNKKKKELLKLAVKYNFMILEDDCLSELYFYNKEPLSLKSLDTENKVIYIKSYSKIFMPGLRLGFIILPEKLYIPTLAVKYATDISSSGLNQRAFELYLKEGYWDNHIKKMKNLFKERFELMLDLIFNYNMNLYAKPQGGLYFWVKSNINSKKIYEKSIKRGVSILPGSVFSLNDASNYFRLSFATVEKEEIIQGMKVLNTIINDEKGKKLYFPIV